MEVHVGHRGWIALALVGFGCGKGETDDASPTDASTDTTAETGGSTTDTSDTVADEVRVEVTAAAGGVVDAFGARLSVPPGALSADTEIVVRRMDPAGLPDGATLAGDALDFGPDGTTFLTPASLTLPVSGSAATGERLVVSWLSGSSWVDLTSTAGPGVVLADVAHFTAFAPRWVAAAAGGNQVTVDGVPVTFDTANVGIPGNNSVSYSAFTTDFTRSLTLYTTAGVWKHTCDGVTVMGYIEGMDQFASNNPGSSCVVTITSLGGSGYPFTATYEAVLFDATGTRSRVLTLGSMEVLLD